MQQEAWTRIKIKCYQSSTQYWNILTYFDKFRHNSILMSETHFLSLFFYSFFLILLLLFSCSLLSISLPLFTLFLYLPYANNIPHSLLLTCCFPCVSMNLYTSIYSIPLFIPPLAASFLIFSSLLRVLWRGGQIGLGILAHSEEFNVWVKSTVFMCTNIRPCICTDVMMQPEGRTETEIWGKIQYLSFWKSKKKKNVASRLQHCKMKF